MASSFLNKKAQERSEKIDKKYGSDAYGGSNYQVSTEQKPSSGNHAAGSTPSKEGKASSFLTNKAKEREEYVAKKWGTETTSKKKFSGSRGSFGDDTRTERGNGGFYGDPDELKSQIDKLTSRQSELTRLISGARRGGLTEERRRFEDEHRSNADEIKRLKTDWEKVRPVYTNETANQKAEAVTNAEAALKQLRKSGVDIETEVKQSGDKLAAMEGELKKLGEAFQANPTEETRSRYLAAYEQFAQAANQYNALYGEYDRLINGYNAAYDDYSSYMNNAKSDASGLEIAGNTIKAGIAGIARAFGSTTDLLLPAEWWDEKDPLSRLINAQAEEAKYLNDKWQESIYGRGKAVEVASMTGKATVEAIPNAILAMMTYGNSLVAQGTTASLQAAQAGTGLASTIGTVANNMVKNPMYWSSFAQTLGPTYEEAKANGASDLQAAATATIQSALNAGVEVSGGIELLPAKVRSGNTSAVLEWVMSMPEEGIEEVIQRFISGTTDKAIYDHDKAAFSFTDPDAIVNPVEMGKEFMMGSAVSGILGGAQIGGINAANSIIDRMDNNRLGKFDTDYQDPAEELDNNPAQTLEDIAREAVQAEIEVSEESDTNPTPDEKPTREALSADVEARAAEAAYEAGKANVPRETVEIVTQAQEEAYNEGRMAAIADMGKNKAIDTQAEIEAARAEMDALAQELGYTYKQNSLASFSGHVQYDFYDQNGLPARGMNHNQAATESELEEIRRNIRQLKIAKSHIASETVEIDADKAYSEDKKTEQKAYASNEPGISDLGSQLSIRDVATVDGIKYTLKMDQDGKYRLSIDRDTSVMGGYISDARANIYKGGPFATRSEAVQEAIDVARAGKLTKTIEEGVNNGEVAEVSVEGRVLEPDVPRQSDGGLLDGLASENLQEDARGGDAVHVPEGDGRESAGRAGEPDAERDGGGRSLGSGEGADLQPASRTVNHVSLNSGEELDNAIARGSNFENSKQRIYEYYKKDPSPAAAIQFLKNEYGTGGASHNLTDGTRAFLDHDAKGLTVKVGSEKHTFTWKAVEKRIRQLIAEGKYLSAPEMVTEGESGALIDYKSSESYKINAALREGVELNESQKQLVANLDSALDKLPDHTGKVYRNITFDGLGDQEALDEFMAGAEAGFMVFDGYTSTSTAEDGYPIDGEFAVRMVIEGQTGKNLEGFGNNFESEVLFKRGMRVSVDRVEYDADGTPTIYMTEVVRNEEAGAGETLLGDHRGEQDRQPEGDSVPGVSEVQEVEAENHDLQHVPEADSGSDLLGREEVQRDGEEVSEVEQKTELATQENPRGNNFTIPETGLKLPKGDKARFKANVEAIKTLRTLMAENRRATPAEQEILSKYVGWGGLANAFDEKKADWAKEYKQLKKLLTEKEYSSARGSTLNAHYTDVGVIRAIYNGLAGLGFKGGRLLEPSAGVGHFAGAMPSEFANNTSWTMVELDELTGNIAKYLYPNADVRVQGFEAAKIPDNYMDMAISNVPFGNYAIVDKSYPKAVTSAIHNYFFAKALDKVRPGGIVAFITSRFTMDAQNDAVRHYIAQRADLLGAIRLPDSAFKGNASTEVVTDILILKKREPGTAYSGETFESTGYHHRDLNIWEQTNDYFAEHPEMVLGTASATGGMYRSNSLTYTAKPGNLQKQIEKAFESIKGKMDYPVQRTQEEIRAEIKQAAGKAKNGQIVKKDGKLYRSQDGVLEAAEDISKANEAIISDVIELRDTARRLLEAQLDDVSEKQIASLRKELNSQYDAFVKKYGVLNSQKNKRLISLDVDAPFILALENYNKDAKTATKADIFNKNTISPVKTVTHVNTVEEGLIVSMNETGGVDAARIAELLGESQETVTRALLDNRLAFKNRDGKLETAEKYLSGNVKAKLRDAEALAEGDPDYEANVEELRKIIPADIAAEDISVQPGATWIPDTVYGDFVAETLGSSNSGWRRNATVTYNKLLGTFSVTVGDTWLKSRPENVSTWGTPDRSFINIFEATLNSKSVTVTRKLDDGSRVVDKQATAAAQEKQEKIRAEFQRWLWADDTRKETLARLYNDVFNNYVTPKYDGSNLTVNGSNAAKPLRPHQKDAVHRIVNSGGNTLLAHKVGAGKTYEMAAAAMKLRQLGIVKKPMFVVPKPLVAQWGNEFLDFFPAAKILVLGDKDFTAANRKLFANRIATGDYDAVILSQEQFKAVPMSVDNQEAFYQEQITALELSIAESARANGKRDPSIKQMEKSKKSFEAKLKKLADMKKDEDNIDFEQLGVDALFVDEAHSYKNLFYSTNMNNVSGLGNKEGSQKAFDLYMKVRYLQSLNGGRGIVFATATPVMNSMSEMYIMQKYLQSDLLESRGLNSFDAWANQFGEVRTVLEMNPSGKGFRQKQSFSRFKNLAELQQMFRAFADVLTDIPGLKIPAMKDGKRIIVESEPSEFQMDYIEKLAERADAIKGRKVDPKDDNMLKITSDGRKLSYTQRMIDPALPYEDGNKIMKCAENVLNIWKESKGIKGTQLIFCDLSTPKGGSNVETTTEESTDIEDISIYDDIRNVLIGAGVPAKEIAFIHDANTNEKKAKLFKDVNDGTVRVLIGSTGKMGVGMNAQKRIVALHHLDAPWRPGDIEQREGRALRQGNMNEEVGMYVYVTKQTFDSRMWDNLQRKASFIHQVMAGDLTARESEGDGDFALSAAEIKAISSGNPLIIEQFEVAAELSKLENLERAHAKEVADAKKRIQKAKTDIANDEMTVQRLKADIAVRKDTSGDKFKIVIGGKTFTERKAAGEALIAEAKKRLKIVRDAETTAEIGSFAGFKLFATDSGDLLLRGKGQYRAQVNMDSPVGTATRLEEAAKRLDTMLIATETRLQENRDSISKLEKTVAAPFDKANDLLELRKRNAEIMAELNPDSEANIAAMGDEDDTDNMIDRQVATGNDKLWSTTRVGNDTKTPMRLSEIVEKIRHDFGIHITTGHIRGAGVAGQYDRQNKGIRTKIANDLPTVSHELGHHLDTTYALTDKAKLTEQLKKELLDGLDQDMKDAYAEKKWPREGLAEYIRKYLQNRETAAIDYPEFTKYFLNSLSTSDAALIAQLADEVNAYYSLDADTATSSIRFREEGSADARTFTEKIKAKASVLYQAWVDANHGIKLFDEATGSNAYTLANNAAYSDAMAGQIIVSDLTDANGQYVAPGLKTALHGINLNNKKEYRLFGEYLTVKHGPERLAEGMRIFADDRKNSTAFMERRAEELEKQYPQFKEAAERLYDFQQQFLRTWGVDTGLVSQASADEWANRWSFYVPLNRAVSEDRRGVGAKRGFANQNSTIKKARGSGLEIVHPVDNIVNNIVKMVNAGVRNNVMRTITNSAEALGANAEYLEKVPTPMVRRGFDMTGVKTSLIEMLEGSDMKENAKETATDIVADLDDILYQYGKGKAHGDVITVLKNGKQEFWKINDPLLLQSITTMSPKKMEGILDAYAVVSRFMTSNITGYNVVWSLFSNFPRDMMTLFTYSKTKNPFKVFGAMGEAYLNKAGKMGKGLDPMYREYVAMGGGSVSAYTADRNLAKRARQKLAGKKISANPLDWISFTSELVEMGPRYATYKLLRENGLNPQEAFAGAMDITVNFRRGGRVARELNKVIPFFNVSVQGLDKFRRWITAEDVGKSERKKAVCSRTISYIAASGALAVLFYALNNSDEEEEKNYEQLSNYQKNSYWNIPLGDGKYFAIPKPRELGVLSSFFETAMEYGIGENSHALDEFSEYAAQNLLPKIASDVAQVGTKGVVETGMSVVGNLGLIGVFGYMGANRDFLGRPIVSSGMQNLEPRDQYTNRTSKIAYWIGQAFDASPTQIDYFFQQVLGGFWKWQKALLPVGSENVDLTLGVQNTYVKDNQYTTDLVDWMYNQADKSTKAKNSHPGDMEAAITAKMDGNMTTFYSRFYGISKDVKETKATRAARQTVLDMIREYQKATDSGALTDAQEAAYAVIEKMGKTDSLPSVMQTTVKDGLNETHELSPVQYVEYQTDYLRTYWEHVEDNLIPGLTQAEKVAVLKSAKTVAGEEATARTLARIGAPAGDYTKKYGNVSSDDVVDFLTGIEIANEDGSVKQAEVVDIISGMDLDDDDAWTLYFSRYDGKTAHAAQDNGISADLYMTAKIELENIHPDYINGKEVKGSRREKVERYLLSVVDSYRDYLFLLGSEFESVKKDADYIMYFGRE